MTDIDVRPIPVTEIKPARYNPRVDLKLGDYEYERLVASIDKFGFVEPLVWNKRTGNLVGGHQRLSVLLDQGTEEVECVVVDMDSKHEKALNLALNKIEGEWDFGKLRELLTDLTSAGYDTKLTGFSITELDQMIGKVEEIQGMEEFPEYNEDIEGQVKKVVCPECGHEYAP